ncbi:MAG: peptidyl-prolyl cis-trans isomerase [Acidobacteria bacterium]|nr:peptidyl-prolyl cis-trans isomerase [Acidobacteriota bacterium]
MLKFFSRLEKTRNAVLLVIGILMVISLVVWGGINSVVSRDGAGGNVPGAGETVAKVASEKVTTGEINALKQGQMGRLPSKYLINSLIGQRVIRVEANRLGLRASDAEVASEIRKQLKSEDGTVTDQKTYEDNVSRQYGTVAAYEQTVRDQLSGQKLEAFLTAGVTVSEEEILKDYQRKNTKFDVNYVSVSVAELAQTLKPTDQELQDYFEKNKANYYISVPQKKIRYIFVNTTKAGEKLPISDADLKAEFDKIPADKKSKGVEGQQIVLRIPKPEFESQVLEKANQIIEKAKKDGPVVSEQAFTDLVRGYSEDAVSKAAGGKLPQLVRDNPNLKNNPNATLPPSQRLLTMKDGEITEPIKDGGNYYIFRRSKEIPKTFEDTKKELEISLRNRKAYAIAADLAQKIDDDLKQTKDAQATAQKFAGQANMSVSEMIKETPFIKPGDNVENIGISPQFEDGIKNLENPNDVGEKTPIQNGFAIPLLVEKKEPRDATFDEVKSQIAETVKIEKARSQVEDIAKQIAAGATSADALNTAATAKGLKAQDQKNFILGSPLGQGPTAATSEQLEDAVYALKQGEVTKTPLKVGDNWYVVGVTKREDAKMEEFAKQHDQLQQSMLQQKRGSVFSDYLAAVRQKMESAGDIKIYNEVLEKLDADSKEDTPPFPIQ